VMAAVPRSRRRARRRDLGAAALLVGPFLALLGVFTVYPMVRSALYSFSDFSALRPSAAQWVGLEQFRKVLSDPTFRRAIANTILLMVITVPTQTFLAVLVGNALNARIRLRSFFRAVYFLPYVTAPVAVGAIMLSLFGPNGIVTSLVHTLAGTPQTAWYAITPQAFALVAIVMVWTQTGFFAVIVLAGLQSIPGDIYEAADLDGAGWWTKLTRITLPLLRPTVLLVLVMGVIVGLQAFDQPYVLSTTGGALPGSPDGSTLTMVMYVYTQSFRYFHMGEASAAAYVVMAIILVFALLQGALQRRAGETR